MSGANNISPRRSSTKVAEGSRIARSARLKVERRRLAAKCIGRFPPTWRRRNEHSRNHGHPPRPGGRKLLPERGVLAEGRRLVWLQPDIAEQGDANVSHVLRRP